MSWADEAEKTLTAAKRKRTADCTENHRSFWRVLQRHMNASAFNGRRATYSEYSGLMCTHEGCGRYWRTKAAYVDQVPDAERRRP